MTAQAGSAPSSPARDALRREMRRKRRALPEAIRHEAARRIAMRLGRLPFIKPGARIAVYVAVRGEIELASFMALAHHRRCLLYLPRLTNVGQARMEFFALRARTLLRPNRFGIPEPVAGTGAPLPARHLDVVLAPLVAFDPRGHRLGMGAGYYDRRLSFLRDRGNWRRPKLIGVAYEFQRVARLDIRPWDVPMDGCVTEKAFYPAMNNP